MDSDNFCCGLTRRTSDAPHTTCEWNSKAKKNIKSLASFVSIINLPCARTFASKSKIYRLTSSCELFTWHCCVLACWHSKGPQPTIDRERREKKRWIFTSTRCWLEKRLTFDQQKRIKNVRIVGRRRAFNSTTEGNIMSIDPLSAGFLICFWQEALTRLALANFIYSLLLLRVSLLTTQERERLQLHTLKFPTFNRTSKL